MVPLRDATEATGRGRVPSLTRTAPGATFATETEPAWRSHCSGETDMGHRLPMSGSVVLGVGQEE